MSKNSVFHCTTIQVMSFDLPGSDKFYIVHSKIMSTVLMEMRQDYNYTTLPILIHTNQDMTIYD